MNTREIQYQKGMLGNYAWSFDKMNMVDNPDFLNALVDGKTQTELAEMFNVAGGTISNWTKQAKEKDYIEIVGNRKNRVIDTTEKGKIITGD